MSFRFIDAPADAAGLADELASHGRIALDCEAAGFHRYSDRLCLVQLSTPSGDYVLDTLSFDPSAALRPALESPDVEVILHGADYDLRLLDRDLKINPRCIFDTQPAAALLGESGLGLAALLERHLGVVLSKKYQRADWARRPLPDDMLEYAVSDTRHLLQLSELLRGKLVELGRMEWAKEEFSLLERIRWEDSQADPVARVKGARDLTPTELAVLREALGWRDQVARARDQAPFRIAGDGPLLEVARKRPRSLTELAAIDGLNPRLAKSEGSALLERLDRVDTLPAADHPRYPRKQSDGRGRPTPEMEELSERLKDVRNKRAEKVGIDRGMLMANSVIGEIAWTHPKTLQALLAVPGVKRWQVEVVGEDLLEVLSRRKG
jgi:ribonuclease D